MEHRTLITSITLLLSTFVGNLVILSSNNAYAETLAQPMQNISASSTCEPNDNVTIKFNTYREIKVSDSSYFRRLCLPMHDGAVIYDRSTDVKAYFFALGFIQNKQFYDPEFTSYKNTQARNEFEGYAIGQGQKRALMPATIPNDDIYTRMVTRLAPQALFSDEYYREYFCTEDPRCVTLKARNAARWGGGSSAKQFVINRLYKKFMAEVMPEILKISDPLNLQNILITTRQQFMKYSFTSNELKFSMNFGLREFIYRPKNIATGALSASQYTDNERYYDKSLKDAQVHSVMNGKKLAVTRGLGELTIKMDETLAEKILTKGLLTCVNKINVLDWVFSMQTGRKTALDNQFAPIWESSSDIIACYGDEDLQDHYFSFNWRNQVLLTK